MNKRILGALFLFTLAAGTTSIATAFLVDELRPFIAVANQHESASSPAATGSPATSAPSGAEQVKCVEQMTAFMTTERAKYAADIQNLFLQPDPASELLEPAVERFRKYRSDLIARYDQFVPEVNVRFEGELGELPECRILVDDELLIAEEVLKTHVSSNAQAKQSEQLVDYYKKLNDRLEELNYDAAELYGYFQTFANKLPCYAQSCTGR